LSIYPCLTPSYSPAIAVGKTGLVILYFMHVRESDRFTWVLVGVGFFWLLILVGGVMDDLLTRSWLLGDRIGGGRNVCSKTARRINARGGTFPWR
jgi:hypothetical protein